MRWLVFSLIFPLAACNAGGGIEVRTVERVVEVEKPCAAQKPSRPDPIGALPDRAVDAARILGAKLLEYAGPGGYADQADAALDRCTNPPA